MKERILSLREHLKLSQDEFAVRIGISRSGVSSLENGSRAVSERHIRLILASFPQVNESWLRTGNGPMFLQQEEKVNQLVAQFSFPEIVAKLLRAYDQLSPDQQAAVLGYARSFLSSLSDPLPAPVSADEKRARDYIAEREKEESSSPSQAAASENG